MRIVHTLLLFVCGNAFGGQLYDLHVGASWTYVVSAKQETTITNNVVDVREINGNRWYKLIEYGDTYWVRNTDKGQVEAVNFFNSDPSSSSKVEESIIFKFPAKVGEKWWLDELSITYQGIKVLQLPAGEFKCHEYLFNLEGEGNYSLSCVAEGIGVVYNESVFDGVHKKIAKLIKYSE